MCQIAINIPKAVLYDTYMSKKDAEAFAKKMVVLGYYMQKRVSIGYCAAIAGMCEEDFIKFLGENRIFVFQSNDEKGFLEELNHAKSSM